MVMQFDHGGKKTVQVKSTCEEIFDVLTARAW